MDFDSRVLVGSSEEVAVMLDLVGWEGFAQAFYDREEAHTKEVGHTKAQEAGPDTLRTWFNRPLFEVLTIDPLVQGVPSCRPYPFLPFLLRNRILLTFRGTKQPEEKNYVSRPLNTALGHREGWQRQSAHRCVPILASSLLYLGCWSTARTWVLKHHTGHRPAAEDGEAEWEYSGNLTTSPNHHTILPCPHPDCLDVQEAWTSLWSKPLFLGQCHRLLSLSVSTGLLLICTTLDSFSSSEHLCPTTPHFPLHLPPFFLRMLPQTHKPFQLRAKYGHPSTFTHTPSYVHSCCSKRDGDTAHITIACELVHPTQARPGLWIRVHILTKCQEICMPITVGETLLSTASSSPPAASPDKRSGNPRSGYTQLSLQIPHALLTFPATLKAIYWLPWLALTLSKPNNYFHTPLLWFLSFPQPGKPFKTLDCLCIPHSPFGALPVPRPPPDCEHFGEREGIFPISKVDSSGLWSPHHFLECSLEHVRQPRPHL